MLIFRNKKIAVLGAGIEGKSAKNFFKNQGAVVSVYDEKEAPFPDLSSYDLVVRSPGVKLSNSRLTELKDKKTITSPTKLFLDLCPTKNIIGVTGTKGKGTTASLIYEILKKDGLDVYLGGNIGTPALDFLPSLNKNSSVVLELSSFQLADLNKSPHIAVVLMVTSEHLNWHKNIDEYIEAKSNIAKYQTENDFVVFGEDYKNSVKIAKKSRGKQVGFNLSHQPPLTESVKVRLPGQHNLENVYAAYSVGKILNADERIMLDTIQKFKGLPHRLEFVAEVGGVKYYDDSFSTTPETTIAAIKSFQEPKILILGGSSKNSDFTKLAYEIAQNNTIKAIIGIGTEWQRIKRFIMNELRMTNDEFKIQFIERLTSMEKVVAATGKVTSKGDLVLLSPACASFGMFENYKDRGKQFKREVLKLAGRIS